MIKYFTLACIFALHTSGYAQTDLKKNLKEHIEILASDSLGGRGTATKYEKLAAEYIAAQFNKVGLKASGNNHSFLQTFPISQFIIDTTTTYLQIRDKKLFFLKDFKRSGGGGAFRPQQFNGRLIYVQGLLEHDLLQDSNLVKGAIIFYNRPRTADGKIDPRSFKTMFKLAEYEPATILFSSDRSEKSWTNAKDDADQYQPMLKPNWTRWSDNRKETTSISFFELKPDIENTFFVADSDKNKFMIVPTTIPVSLNVSMKMDSTMHGTNVIGYLEGKNPAADVIVISAHYDGLGISKHPAGKDSVYNGADDNASGIATLIELAKFLEKNQPEQHYVFAAFSGEENGLWGSSYFVQNIPVNIKKIKANINIDMIGRPYRPGALYMIGLEELKNFESIQKSISNQNVQLKSGLEFEQDFPRQFLLYRSDQINFIQKGIPGVLILSSGLHKDYHELSDETGTIDFDHLESMTNYLSTLINAVDKGKFQLVLKRDTNSIMDEWHLKAE